MHPRSRVCVSNIERDQRAAETPGTGRTSRRRTLRTTVSIRRFLPTRSGTSSHFRVLYFRYRVEQRLVSVPHDWLLARGHFLRVARPCPLRLSREGHVDATSLSMPKHLVPMPMNNDEGGTLTGVRWPCPKADGSSRPWETPVTGPGQGSRAVPCCGRGCTF